MNFDPIAPWYRWLEYAAFGTALQSCRNHHLGALNAARRVLMLGEGDGRFLRAFTRLNARSEVDYVDASGAMLALARSRLARKAATATKTRFCQLDVRHQALPGTSYDLIVTHFFLDCLDDLEVKDLVRKVANSADLNARWVVSDFAQPEGGVWKYIGMWLVQVLYLFFRKTACLEARKLPSYRPALRSAGFVLEKKERFGGGILFSEIWRRSAHGPLEPSGFGKN